MAKDTMDAIGGASFDEVYQNQIEPDLEALNGGRILAVQTFGLALFGGVLLAVVEFFLLPALRLPQLWLMTIVLAGLAGYIPIRRVARTAKSDVLSALCGPLGVAYQAEGFEPAAFSDFRELRLLAASDHNQFEDHFAGSRNGRAFGPLCGAKLVQGSGRSAQTVFCGQLMKLDYPRPFSGVTVVLRDNGWLNRFACPPGLAKVGLEDPRFEETFEVFGSDQVEARAILTPTFMEQLLALEGAYAGEHIRCAFVRGEAMVAIEGPKRFEMGSMFSTLMDRSRVQAIAADLNAVFRLMDSFLVEPVRVAAAAAGPELRTVKPSAPASRAPAKRRRRAAAG